jgi:hypothetical protein
MRFCRIVQVEDQRTVSESKGYEKTMPPISGVLSP